MGENIEHALDVKVPGATSIDRAGTFSFTASASDVPRVHGYSALEGMFFGGCIFSGRAAAGAFATRSSLPCVGMAWKNNWFGDVTTNGGTWISIWCSGCVFEGNAMFGMSGNGVQGISLNTSRGVVIMGNAFDLLGTAINCTTAVGGLLVTGNNFGGSAGGTVTNAGSQYGQLHAQLCQSGQRLGQVLICGHPT